MEQMDLLITGIRSLVTPEGKTARRGAQMRELHEYKDAAIAIRDGHIFCLGEEKHVLERLKHASITSTIDAGGRLAVPGFVDPHTHLVHGGSREHELALKRSGVPYLDILSQGGGILSTVRATREASEQELYDKAYRSLNEMLLQGVTTVEAKSGYGLSLEAELKQLRVVQALDQQHAIDLVSTFMGAHAVPEEFRDRAEEYVASIIEDMLPAIASQGLAEYCDVFCEQGVFSLDQSRRLLLAAKQLGLLPKLHADEILPLGGAQLAAEVGAISADHLLLAADEGLQRMSDSYVIPVLLPGTSFNLGLTQHARARTMIDEYNLPVALATDYNPGSCPSESIQLIMMLASLNLKMLPEEILTAITLNAAAAIGRGEQIGSLEAGKRADITLLDAPNLMYLPYHFGINHTYGVIKSGSVVVWGQQLTTSNGRGIHV